MNVLNSLDFSKRGWGGGGVPMLQLVLVPLGLSLCPSEQSQAPNTKSL